MDGFNDGWLNYWLCLRIVLWLHVNIAVNTVSTEAINFTATAISSLPDTAVNSAYAYAESGPFLAK